MPPIPVPSPPAPITALGMLLCSPPSNSPWGQELCPRQLWHQGLALVHRRCLINNNNDNDQRIRERQGHTALEALRRESIPGRVGEKGTDRVELLLQGGLGLQGADPSSNPASATSYLKLSDTRRAFRL